MKSLADEGQRLFSSRLSLLSLWQEIADHFYPERADFTTTRTLGEEFANHLASSQPVRMRNELGDTFGAMLRPSEEKWFNIVTSNYEDLDIEAKRWLEWATNVQYRAMYDPKAMFVKATKEGDQFFAAFGQAVISRELDFKNNTLLYRNWHIRDVAWEENDRGEIDTVFRKWKPMVREVARIFGADKLSQDAKQLLDKAPHERITLMHAVIPATSYTFFGGTNKYKTQFVSVFLEMNNGNILLEQPTNDLIYTIPRWKTISGSQYAYSPATMLGLPDARLLQSMTLAILEAGEKIANPPQLAVEGAIRSDLSLYAGGVTWVDKEYDNRTGRPLEPLRIDVGGLGVGLEMQNKVKEDLYQLFFLNKVSLPPMVGEVTTFEISQRIQEYTRQALPLFEPVVQEYNASLCENTFNLLLKAGAFGAPQDIPQSLQGKDISFRFESPLRTAAEKQKAQIFMQAKAMVAEAAAIDPKVVSIVNAEEAIRDSIGGLGAPHKWLRSPTEVDAINRAAEQAAQQQQMMQAMQQGANIAATTGKAATYFKEVQ